LSMCFTIGLRHGKRLGDWRDVEAPETIESLETLDSLGTSRSQPASRKLQRLVSGSAQRS